MHHETPDNRIHDLHPTDIPGWYMGDELQDDARIGLAIRVWHSWSLMLLTAISTWLYMRKKDWF